MAWVTLTVGQIQQGKTTLALYQAIHESRRVIVLDLARAKPFDRITPAWQFRHWAPLARWLVNDSANYRRWCLTLRSDEPMEYVALLQAAPKMREVLLLVDELPKLLSVPEAVGPVTRVAQTGANMGGGRGVRLRITAQRPLNVPPNIRSQAERIESFRQREPGDLAWLEQFAGEAFATEVAGLGSHQWRSFPPNEGARTGRAGDESRSLAGRRGDRAGDPGGPPAPGEVQPGEQGTPAVQVGAGRGASGASDAGDGLSPLNPE
jgi:hypothetical protein